MIRVNEYEIKEQEFNYALNDFKAQARIAKADKKAVETVAAQLINAKLLLDEAIKQNLTVTEEEINKAFNNLKSMYPSEEAFEKALNHNQDNSESLRAKLKNSILLQKFIHENIVSRIEVTEENALKYYNEYKDQFVSQPKIHASHILFGTEDLEKAQEVYQEIANGADFAEMAKIHSNCPSKEKGGDLGEFGRKVMVKEFEDAAFTAEIGKVTEPVKTNFGYHLILVHNKIDSKNLEFEEVKENLKNNIKNNVVHYNINKKAQELRANAKIEFDQEALAKFVEA